MDLDAVHDAMRARNAEGNTVPDSPRDSPRPGRDYTAASDNDFTEVKAESEKGKCDVAPTEDEEEMNPPAFADPHVRVGPSFTSPPTRPIRNKTSSE